jgi:hypothetical protein
MPTSTLALVGCRDLPARRFEIRESVLENDCLPGLFKLTYTSANLAHEPNWKLEMPPAP